MLATKFNCAIRTDTKSSSNGWDHVEDAGPQLEGDAGDDWSVVVKVENGNVAMKPLSGLKNTYWLQLYGHFRRGRFLLNKQKENTKCRRENKYKT